MKNKRRWIGLSVLVVLGMLMVVVGCESTPSPTGTGAVTKTVTTIITATPTTTQPEVIKWTMQLAATTAPAMGPFDSVGGVKVHIAVAKWLENVSKGRLKIEFAQPASLFPVADSLKAVKSGVVQMAIVYAGYHAGILPEAIIESGLLLGPQTAWDVAVAGTTYGVEDILREAYAEYGVYHVCMIPWLPSTTIQSTFQMPNPDSIKGRKIRATGYDGDVITLMGATPVNIPALDTYMALKLGTVDGALLTLPNLEEFKTKEVISDVLVINLKRFTECLFVNQEALAKLPADIREIFLRDARFIGYGAQMQNESEAEYMYGQAKKNYGIREWTWPDTYLKQLTAKVTTEVWPKYRQMSPRCARLLDAYMRFLQDFGRI